MRTQEEIVARIKSIRDLDAWGHESSDLISYLDREHAMQVLPAESAEMLGEDWKPHSQEKEVVTAVIRDYLPFAQDKASCHRGLSAARSVSHLRAWFWIAGDDEMVEFIDAPSNGCQYGARIIAEAARRLNVPLSADEEFQRLATEPCPNGC